MTASLSRGLMAAVVRLAARWPLVDVE